ncbi:MAG TPA: PAS domain S-box protein, partial [Rhodothermales bacterium]|nr:PAS domain S-box protein [Rhodothermales bacterium]
MTPPIRPFVPIALYEGALDALPAGVLVFHLDVPDDPGSLRLLYANSSASQVAGLDFTAHLGETLRDFLPGLLETDLPAQYTRVALTGEGREIGDVPYSDDGVRPGIYSVRAFGLPDQSVGLLLEDVTEKRRIETEREEEREFLGAVLENVSDGIVACNSEGELTLFNRATREFHGLPAEPIPAGAWAEHYSLSRADGSPLPTEEIPLMRALHGEVLRDEPMRIVPKEGTPRMLLASGRPLAGATGEPLGAVVAMRDVTANEQAQAEVLALVATQRELEEQARTLETINRVNASLAAELEPEGLVQAVTDAGTELTEAQFGAFFYNVINRAGESYMLYTISGVPREAFSQFPMPRNTDVFHATFSGESVMRLDDVTKDPRYGNNPPYHGMPAGHLPVRSYLAVPVKNSRGEVIGGLFFGHEKPGVFDERAEQIALALADQAAIALQNARLYTELQTELADRRQVEGALRESESRYRALIQAAPDVVFAYTFDDDGRPGPFIEFNDAALRTYGYTREEAARLTPADLIAPDAREKISGRVDRLRAEGQVLFETTHVTKNGREIPMEASAQLFQLDGRDAVLAVCRDVTERREAEVAVRRALTHAEEAERQLLAVVDNLPELAWTAEPDGTIDFYNRRWYAYTGTTPGQMEGGGWHAVHDPVVLPTVLERWRHSIATGEPFEMEYPLRGADGVYRWFLTRVQPLRDTSGRIVRWVGTNANIDEQRRLLAERDAVLERLVASERQFRLLTDAVPQLIWTSTAEGTPDFYNERWYSYTGMARPDAAGAGFDPNWGDYVHPDDREGAFAAFGRAAAAAAPFEYEYRFRHHDGSYRWFLGRALPTLDDGGQVAGW